MTIARTHRILVIKIFANVDQMQNVLGRQIRAKQGRADVVRVMNAPEDNIVTLENAKVCHFWFPNRLKYFCISPKHHSKISPTILENNYVQISDFYLCEHANGGIPYYCYQSPSTNCSEECNQLHSCVGYSTGTNDCLLFPSYGSCPSGWSMGSDSVATASSQLVSGTSHSGYKCYRKGSLYQIN